MKICLLGTLWLGNCLAYSASKLVVLICSSHKRSVCSILLISIQCKWHCLQCAQYSFVSQLHTLVLDVENKKVHVTTFTEHTQSSYCNVVVTEKECTVSWLHTHVHTMHCSKLWKAVIVVSSDQPHHSVYT
jgi:hypothetical protein